MSQSAVSAAIRELEEELGIRIFHRSNREHRPDGGTGGSCWRRWRRWWSAAARYRIITASGGWKIGQGWPSAPSATPFCAKAFVEFLHLLDQPRIEVSLKETDMSSVIEEVAGQQSDLGVLFVTDMTESFIRRIYGRAQSGVFRPGAHPSPCVSAAGASAGAVRGRDPRAAARLPQRGVHPAGKQPQLRRGAWLVAPARILTAWCISTTAPRPTMSSPTRTACPPAAACCPRATATSGWCPFPCASRSGDMRLGYVKLRGISLTEQGTQFVDILKKITAENPGEPLTEFAIINIVKINRRRQTAGGLFRIGQREPAAALTQKHHIAGDDGGAAEEEVGLGVRAAAGVIGEAERVQRQTVWPPQEAKGRPCAFCRAV